MPTELQMGANQIRRGISAQESLNTFEQGWRELLGRGGAVSARADRRHPGRGRQEEGTEREGGAAEGTGATDARRPPAGCVQGGGRKEKGGPGGTRHSEAIGGHASDARRDGRLCGGPRRFWVLRGRRLRKEPGREETPGRQPRGPTCLAEAAFPAELGDAISHGR